MLTIDVVREMRETLERQVKMLRQLAVDTQISVPSVRIHMMVGYLKKTQVATATVPAAYVLYTDVS